MLPSQKGAFRLFSAFGIQVFLHWSWFLVAYYRFQTGKEAYENPAWMLAEYVSLFAIVLLHEFGHSLACRSVGGSSDQIILWPFGGIAFVRPPHRPGAFLWSIAAGPLVNVALVPVLFAVRYVVGLTTMMPMDSELAQFLNVLIQINFGLLVFNVFPIYAILVFFGNVQPAFWMLPFYFVPIYPLDGGQIFQSILWYFVGYAKSIFIAAGLGMIGGVGMAVYGFLHGQYFLGFIALFLVSQSWSSFQIARQILQQERSRQDAPTIEI